MGCMGRGRAGWSIYMSGQDEKKEKELQKQKDREWKASTEEGRVRAEVKARWKEMTRQQKITYFKDYYLLPTVLIGAGAFILLSLLWNMTHKPPTPVLEVAVVGNLFQEGSKEDITIDMANRLGVDPDLIMLDDSFTNDYNGLMKLVAMMSTREITAVVTTEDQYKNLAAQGSLYDLREILTAEEAERFKPYFVEAPEYVEGMEDELFLEANTVSGETEAEGGAAAGADGAGTDGAGADGASADGASADGAGADGAGADGAGADGTGADAGGAGEAAAGAGSTAETGNMVPYGIRIADFPGYLEDLSLPDDAVYTVIYGSERGEDGRIGAEFLRYLADRWGA